MNIDRYTLINCYFVLFFL